jgi:L-asparaginase II
MSEAIAAATGVEHPEGGVDGCGMPALRVPLDSLGSAFAALDARIAGAMLAHPHLVAFEGSVDTELLRRGVVAKVGAEGILAWSGGALKVRDGAMRAAEAAAALLFDLPPVELRNSLGEVVGRLEAVEA